MTNLAPSLSPDSTPADLDGLNPSWWLDRVLEYASGLLIGMYVGDNIAHSAAGIVQNWPGQRGAPATNSVGTTHSIAYVRGRKCLGTTSNTANYLTATLPVVTKSAILIASPHDPGYAGYATAIASSGSGAGQGEWFVRDAATSNWYTSTDPWAHRSENNPTEVLSSQELNIYYGYNNASTETGVRIGGNPPDRAWNRPIAAVLLFNALLDEPTIFRMTLLARTYYRLRQPEDVLAEQLLRTWGTKLIALYSGDKATVDGSNLLQAQPSELGGDLAYSNANRFTASKVNGHTAFYPAADVDIYLQRNIGTAIKAVLAVATSPALPFGINGAHLLSAGALGAGDGIVGAASSSNLSTAGSWTHFIDGIATEAVTAGNHVFEGVNNASVATNLYTGYDGVGFQWNARRWLLAALSALQTGAERLNSLLYLMNYHQLTPAAELLKAAANPARDLLANAPLIQVNQSYGDIYTPFTPIGTPTIDSSGVHFNGSDQAYRLLTGATTEFTLVLRAKLNVAVAGTGLFAVVCDGAASGSGLGFGVNIDGNWRLLAVGVATTTTTIPVDSDWHVWTMKRSAVTGVTTLFLDSIKIAETAFGTMGNGYLDLAAIAAGPTNFLDCIISTVSFSNGFKAPKDQLLLEQYTGLLLNDDQQKAAQIPVDLPSIVSPFTVDLRSWGTVNGAYSVTGAPVITSNGTTFDGIDDAATITSTALSTEFTSVGQITFNNGTTSRPGVQVGGGSNQGFAVVDNGHFVHLDSHDSGYLYVSSAAATSVGRIRISDGTTDTSVAVGTGQYHVSWNSKTHLYCTSVTSSTVARLNLTTLTLETSITVGTTPYDCAWDGDNHMYVTNNGAGTVSRINLSTGLVDATINVGVQPTGIAWDGGDYMYVCNNASNTVQRIHVVSGVASAPIGVGVAPFNVCWCGGSHMFVSNGTSNTITRIRISDGTVEPATIAVGTTPTGMCWDGKNHIYVANFGSANVSRINTETNTVDATIAVGTQPRSATWDGCNHVYVPNFGAASVSRINITTGNVVATIGVSASPRAISTPFASILPLLHSANNITACIRRSSEGLTRLYASGLLREIMLNGAVGGTTFGTQNLLAGRIKNHAVLPSNKTAKEQLALEQWSGLALDLDQTKAASIPVDGAVIVAPFQSSLRSFGARNAAFKISGAPVITPSGCFFDGLDDFITLESDNSAEFTVVCLAHSTLTGVPYGREIMQVLTLSATGNSGYGVFQYTNDNYHLHLPGVVAVDSTYTDNQKPHVLCLKRVAGVTYLYIDGVPYCSTASAAAAAGTVTMLGASRQLAGGTYFWRGYLRNFAFWLTALSATNQGLVERWCRTAINR